jgi:hypothetical protein
MNEVNRNMIAYLVACVSEFASATDLSVQAAHRYLSLHGGIDFLVENYEAEHLLSLDDAVSDLKEIAQQSGGMLA